jgi:hypothetical protein
MQRRKQMTLKQRTLAAFSTMMRDAERGLIDDLAVTDIADNATDQAFADLARAESVDLYSNSSGMTATTSRLVNPAMTT